MVCFFSCQDISEMANRADTAGINADMQKKLEMTYPAEDEVKVRDWINTIVGGEDLLTKENFWDELKDGSRLCTLLNCLQPGIIASKFEKKQSHNIKQVETVGVFLGGCRNYGMQEKDLFVSLDLQELRNKNMVIASLFSLGRTAQKNEYDGPVLGPKEAEANPREFTEEQLREGKNVVNTRQMGTNEVASQAGMTPYGKGRQIADTRVV